MITIITKSYCPYCSWAKQFLESIGKDFKEIEVSNDQETYEKYQEISGMKTVPQIFNGEAKLENLIGGYDEMMTKFKSGNLFNS